MKKDCREKTSVIPRIAKKMGQKSVDSACLFWINQPKVPAQMKKSK